MRIGFFVFTRAMNSVENIFRRYNNPVYQAGYRRCNAEHIDFSYFRPLYGEGYDTINLLLNGVTNQ